MPGRTPPRGRRGPGTFAALSERRGSSTDTPRKKKSVRRGARLLRRRRSRTISGRRVVIAAPVVLVRVLVFGFLEVDRVEDDAGELRADVVDHLAGVVDEIFA